MLQLRLSLAAVAALAAAAAAAGGPVRVHVAPAAVAGGARDDRGEDGSEGSPFATLHAAQAGVRTLLAAGAAPAGVEVRVAPGRYQLERPLRFTSADSGRVGARVVWKGVAAAGDGGGGEARILGGEAVGGWERVWGEVHRTRLGRRVYGLSENGRQANPARHPNTNPGSGSGWLGGANGGGFSWAAGQLPPNVSTFGLGNTSMVMTAGTGYYWSESWAVESFDLTARTATFRPDEGKAASHMPAGQSIDPNAPCVSQRSYPGILSCL